jgi:protein-disulfide isomerase
MNTKLLFAASALALVLVFAIVAFVEKGGGREDAMPAGRPLVAKDPALVVRPGSPSYGKPDAKVTLVEFLDPACETCAAFYPEVKRLQAANPDRLRIVVRHVPFHPGSDDVVRMLEAARLQDLYWPALEALLRGQPRWVVQHRAQPEQAIAVLAEVPGLDVARIRSDMQRDDVRARVDQDFADAKALRVAATPEYFVNGRPLPTFGLDELKRMVSDALR